MRFLEILPGISAAVAIGATVLKLGYWWVDRSVKKAAVRRGREKREGE